MFESIFDFFGGTKISEKFVSIRNGTLKVILKERNSKRYMYLRFSYTGNVQYHLLHKEDVDDVIDAMAEFKKLM
ncbi:MAG: hypothetical protein GY948_02130 [Alphaproteobacteria bacterium]|nr:hypothetical protein [Alphaproteobacteria bacterium]